MGEFNSGKLNFFRHTSLRDFELLTCSDSSYSLPPHFNIDYCIWLDAFCAEKYSCKGHSHTLAPGEFSIIEPGDVHSNGVIDVDERKLVTFYLSSELLQQVAVQMDEKSGEVQLCGDSYHDRAVFPHLIYLQRLMETGGSELETRSVYIELISVLIKRYGTLKLKDVSISGEQRRVNMVRDVMHSLFAENISLDMLADTAGCTPYHLIRFFRSAVGMPPYAYLIQLRLELAKKMIKQGKTLAETAFDAGFADQSHMNRHFRSRYGITPGMYKKQVS